MKLPAIRGVIDRRILANYRIDAEYMAKALPEPFSSKVGEGFCDWWDLFDSAEED